MEPAKALRERIAGMTAHDQASADALGQASREARKLKALINKNREDIKAPVLKLERAIDAMAKQGTEPLEQAAADADAKVKAWNDQELARVKREREEQERRAREAQAKREAAEKAEREAQERANKAIREAQEAEERATALKTKAARQKAEAEAQAKAALAAQAQAEVQQAQAQADAATVDQRVAEQRGEAVQEAAAPAGYRKATETTWDLPDYTKIPPALLPVVLMPNDKVLAAMIKTGQLTEAKHGAWLTIHRAGTLVRSRPSVLMLPAASSASRFEHQPVFGSHPT